jgi:hypothetical protein
MMPVGPRWAVLAHSFASSRVMVSARDSVGGRIDLENDDGRIVAPDQARLGSRVALSVVTPPPWSRKRWAGPRAWEGPQAATSIAGV